MKPNLESLTEEQKDRLRKLESELRFDKLTVSFSIEDRDGAGRRKQTFFSASVSRNDGKQTLSGWTQQEVQLVSCMLSRQVVLTTYRDALRRKVLPREVVQTELPGILAAYDHNLMSLAAGKADADEGIGRVE